MPFLASRGLTLSPSACSSFADFTFPSRPHVCVLGRRGFLLESAAARVCREAGARVRTNVMVRDMDLVPAAAEVVADGLPLYRGAQLAIETTLLLC